MYFNRLMSNIIITAVVIMSIVVLSSCNPSRVDPQPPSVPSPTEQEVKALSWVNYDGAACEGGIIVSWEPATEIVPSHARIIWSPPIYLTSGAGYLHDPRIANGEIKRSSSADPDIGLRVSCGDPEHTVTKVSFFSGGTQTDFEFPDFPNCCPNNIVPLSKIALYNVKTWVGSKSCLEGSESYENECAGINITALITCQRPNGTEYEIEDNERYNVFATCEHLQ